ncbi:MAG: flagellar filament capping protein FliD, partial [Desulfitobacterium sp.]|nr:flagellar filament capping protein FliD [Desulfitobacterium sp.]
YTEDYESVLSAKGKNAQFILDGMELEQEKNSFTISGVTYNLKSVGEANLVVSADNDKAIEAVKDFINSYNAILEKINGELNEPKYTKYLPLTDEQKKELNEHQIKEWDELAKSGMLRRDTILQDIVFKMRQDISTAISEVGGKYKALSAIGINTGDYSEGGKLYLNETALREALEEDPDVVYRLFASSGDDYNSQGVAMRLYDTLKGSMDRIKIVAGTTPSLVGDTESFLAKQIKDYEDSLDRMDYRLQRVEERYYKQFDAMELALSRLTQQSNWLFSQFAG